MEILNVLQTHPLFATFTPKALAEAVSLATPVAYAPGDLLVRHDEPGEVFGLLISGRAEAVRRQGAAPAQLLGTIEPGECFGEISLLTGNPTNADVVAAAPSETIIFLQEAIGPLIAVNREAVQFLTKLITRRLLAQGVAPAPVRRAPAPRYALGAVAPLRILAITCRQDDVRYAYFDTTSEQPRASGRISGLDTTEAVHAYQGPKDRSETRLGASTHEAALRAAVEALTSESQGLLRGIEDLSAIGHCVRHGGAHFNGPAVIDDEVKGEIRRLADLAPMDNPYNLRGIEACERLAPKVPQVAVFDTAFHLTMPQAACRYALPKDLADGITVRRFGCHGLSHSGAARAAALHLGASFDALRIITCHLGRGASLTAIDHGRSVDNSMGFTPLEGLVMATRPGDVDAGLILHLVRRGHIAPDELYRRLFAESGLLGLSGLSGDVVTLAEAAEKGNPEALLAVQVFCQRAKKYLGAYIGLLGGADAIVFTGGVGENSPGVRARICQGLDWMGIVLDEGPNRSARVGPGGVCTISTPHSRACVLVVGSDEERTIARETVRAFSHARVTEVMRGKPREIPIGVSSHHVHLTPAHVAALFGQGHKLTWHADLTQPGQYACQEQVSLIGPKGRIDRVRVLGPERPESQVEIARTEQFKLGIDASLRMSGDLDGSPGITLEGPAGQVRLERGVICAMRHIHMSPEDAMEAAVRDHDIVRVRIAGERSLIFGDVVVRVDPNFRLDMHIDTDEANAAELDSVSAGQLDSIQQRASV